MTVPEAAPNIDKRMCPRHYNVGSAGEAPVAYAEPPSGGKNALPHEHLGLRILAVNSAHDTATLFWGDSIHKA